MAFGGFGTTPTSSAFGGSAFGATSKPSSFGTGFGGFGTTTTSAPAFGAPSTGFGAATSGFGTSTMTSGFGASTMASGFGTSSTAPAFGTSLGSGGGAFSFSSTPSTSLFRPTATFGNQTTTPFGGFQQQQQQPLFQQQQQPQQQQNSEIANLCTAVTACAVFGDDRDALMARWNLLQASWGVGKAYYNAAAPPVTLTADNPLCRFKAVGYSAMPKTDKESESQLSCVVRRKPSETEKNRAQIIADLSSALGNRPNIKVTIDAINGYDTSDLTELIFSVAETNPTNGAFVRRVPANDVLSVIGQPNVAQALQQKHAMEAISPRCAYTEEQLRDYLDNPPQGIDPRLWRQAQLDNPDPKKLLPVPMIGFRALQTRIKCQEMQAKNQQGLLDAIATDISKLQKNQQETSAKLYDAKRKQLELGHRVLKVIIGQEVTRKRGYTIQPEEEHLRIQLEALQAEMSAPTQFKGRLNELLSQVRLQSQASAMSGGGEKYNMDPFLISDIRALLKQQQDGLQALVSSIKMDMTDLNLIEQHGKA